MIFSKGKVGVVVKTSMVGVNSKAPRCIDGRRAIMIVEWNGSAWVVAKRGGRAASEFGPQFLGAGLMFVRLLQEVAHLSLEAAFERTEDVFSVLKWTPQFHIDDHGGDFDFANMDEEEVIDVLTLDGYLEGCGFAGCVWGEEAGNVLRMAVKRKWRIQILEGRHAEKGATLNEKVNTTFKTPAYGGQTRFNLDLGDAKLVALLLNSLNDFGSDFYELAVKWIVDKYGEVVVLLRGVSDVSEIEVIK